MATVAVRRRGRGALVMLVFALAGGCTSAPEPPPQPAASPMYEKPPRNLCDRARLDDLALRRGMIRVFESPGRLRNHGESWHISCGVGGWSDDDELATEIGRFDPGGTVVLNVFPDPGGAVEDYERLADAYKRHADRDLHASNVEVEGWWEAGRRMRTFRRLGPDVGIEELDAIFVEVRYTVRHHNLVVEVYTRGRLPGGHLNDGYKFLDDMALAMIEEATTHLTLSG